MLIAQRLSKRNGQRREVNFAAEKDGGDDVKSVAAEIGSNFDIVIAARQTEVVHELDTPLRAIRGREEFATEIADAGHIDARAERIYRVGVERVAHRLKTEFVRGAVAE